MTFLLSAQTCGSEQKGKCTHRAWSDAPHCTMHRGAALNVDYARVENFRLGVSEKYIFQVH